MSHARSTLSMLELYLNLILLEKNGTKANNETKLVENPVSDESNHKLDFLFQNFRCI